MAQVNKDLIQITGLSVNAPLVVDGGANGSYAVAAHQIKWDNSTFNGNTFEGTSQGLLTAIEEAIQNKTVDLSSYITYDYLTSYGTSYIYAHTSDSDIHVKLEDKTKWNNAASAVEYFFGNNDIDIEVIDTLKNIQDIAYTLNKDIEDAYSYAEGAYGRANNAYSYAESAYARGNNAYSYAESAYGRANNAYTYAEAAYARANNAYSYAEAAYLYAYNVREDAYFYAETATNTASYLRADNAYSYAEAAYARANAAYTYAESAYARGNNAYSYAESAYARANAAYTYADSAYSRANYAYYWADDVYNFADTLNTYTVEVVAARADTAYAEGKGANQRITNLDINSISWDNDSYVNCLFSHKNGNDDWSYIPKTYYFYGERTNLNDGLPITNSSPGHTIFGQLTALNSSLAGDGSLDNDKCITQILTLSNRQSRDGGMYIRTGFADTYDELNKINSTAWNPWGKVATNIELGIVNDNSSYYVDTNSGTLIAKNDGKGLYSAIDNGIYSGIYVYYDSNRTITETFVVITINNYVAAAMGQTTQTISQLKYAVNTLTKEVTVLKRSASKVNGEVKDWTPWTPLGADENEINNIIKNYLEQEANGIIEEYLQNNDLTTEVTIGTVENVSTEKFNGKFVSGISVTEIDATHYEVNYSYVEITNDYYWGDYVPVDTTTLEPTTTPSSEPVDTTT